MKNRKQISALARLRSRAGESIGEVLVALLIAALGIMLLAGMITSSINVVSTSKKSTLNYISAENAIVTQSGTSAGSGEVSVELGGSAVSLRSGSDSVSVAYYTNDALAGDAVVSYRAAP